MANMTLVKTPMPEQDAKVRARSYAPFERHAYEDACNLFKKEVQ